MTAASGRRWLAGVLFLAVNAAHAAAAEPAAAIGSPSCATPPALSAVDASLDRTVSRLEAGKPLTLVAMGSSSTQGVGASAPAMSYPSRLAQELTDRFPSINIRVINHGTRGEDVPEE
ncbi:MAG TPA: hypothetical protein VE687_03780, partial [Stellaceae bacterium]|nr:hypothetical protein [Stellaceae bacterium]